MKSVLVNAVMSLAFGLLGAALLFSQVLPLYPRVVTVDVNELVRARIDALQRDGVDAVSAERDAIAWANRLETVFQERASKENLLLIAAPAVVAGADDITGQFTFDIDEP